MRDSSLCELVLDMTAGSPRRWTLREDNQSHYHGVVSLNESPLVGTVMAAECYSPGQPGGSLSTEFGKAPCRRLHPSGSSRLYTW